ncbi:HAAS signaling domain-containing protein [Pseudactinotalea sp.]|uniref:HAAS signaling domain-containing protein n=1 Tax=Pseudactinotalea sp. TaxID=1926260 RepID=UPI003B3BBE9F
MTSTTDRTTAYLDDLARMLGTLDPLERADVLDGVRDHVSSALGDLGREPSDADLDRIFADLGSPGDVAAAALADRAGSMLPPSGQRPALSHAWVPPVATGLIFLGAAFGFLVLPVALLLAGLVLLWISPLWSAAEKVVGTILPVLGLGGFALSGLLLFHVEAGDSTGGVTPLGYLLIAAALAGLATLVLVAVRGGRRARRWGDPAPEVG